MVSQMDDSQDLSSGVGFWKRGGARNLCFVVIHSFGLFAVLKKILVYIYRKVHERYQYCSTSVSY